VSSKIGAGPHAAKANVNNTNNGANFFIYDSFLCLK